MNMTVRNNLSNTFKKILILNNFWTGFLNLKLRFLDSSLKVLESKKLIIFNASKQNLTFYLP